MGVRTFPCSADLSGSLHKFVRHPPGGGNEIELNTAPGTASLGVLAETYNNGVSGQWGVVYDGPDLQSIVAGGAFSVGDELANDATARAVKASNLADSVVAGIAMRAALLAGDVAQYVPYSNSGADSGVGGASGLLTSASTAGATLTAAAAASMIPAANRVTVPAGTFNKLGQVMRVKAGGRISSVITTPGTARFDMRLGASVIFDSLAILLDTVAAHVNVGWSLELFLVVNALGGTANFMGHGLWTCEDLLGTPATAPKGSLSAVLPWNQAPATGAAFNAAAALVLDSFFTQTVATGSLTCDSFSVYIDTPSQYIAP